MINGRKGLFRVDNSTRRENERENLYRYEEIFKVIFHPYSVNIKDKGIKNNSDNSPVIIVIEA